MTEDRDDPEWTLSAGAWRCTVAPFGASLRRVWRETPDGPRDVVWGYSGKGAKRGGQGDVLLPFPGRVAGGAYTFAGARHELARNDKEGPNAIHGFARGLRFEGRHDASSAGFRTRIRPGDHPGYPFDLEVVVGYELLPSGLACAFVVRNAGVGPAPVGAGFHPYLAAPAGGGIEGAPLQVPAARLVEFRGLLPTGRVVDAPPALDFREARPLAGAHLNHCLTGLRRDGDGFARVRFGGTQLWMDRAFTHVVLYTGDALGPDARRALAVEPMTCATDAFNRPEWGLKVLQPGEAFSGTWGLAADG